MRMLRTGALCSLSVAVSMSLAVSAWAQEKVGVVTAVAGPVTVARTSTPPEPLKFKDPVFLRDRVTTGDNAITRILLGGKVIVTARERSTLTITEVPGLSTIALTSGRIAVAVDKTKMKPGERVDVRTPNAIAGVRGTVLIVEAQGNTSTVTVLRGLVDVVRVDPKTGRAVGPVTPVGANQAVSVRNNVLPPRPQAITSTRAQDLSREFTPPVRPIAAGTVMPVEDEVDRATTLLNALLPPAAPRRDGSTATASGSNPATVGETPTVGGTVDQTRTSLSATSVVTTAPTLTTPVLTTTTTLVPTTSVAPTTTLVPPPPPTGLLQPIVQPVVQTVVNPVTKLLK